MKVDYNEGFPHVVCSKCGVLLRRILHPVYYNARNYPDEYCVKCKGDEREVISNK